MNISSFHEVCLSMQEHCIVLLSVNKKFAAFFSRYFRQRPHASVCIVYPGFWAFEINRFDFHTFPTLGNSSKMSGLKLTELTWNFRDVSGSKYFNILEWMFSVSQNCWKSKLCFEAWDISFYLAFDCPVYALSGAFVSPKVFWVIPQMSHNMPAKVLQEHTSCLHWWDKILYRSIV